MASFVSALQMQLSAMGLPQSLHERAAEKITQQIFDAGSAFCFQEYDESIVDEEETEGLETVPTAYSLHAISEMAPECDVFLIDHMWYLLLRAHHAHNYFRTTTFPQSRRHLQQFKELRERICMLSFYFRTSLHLGGALNLTIPDSVSSENEANWLWDRIWPYMNTYMTSANDYSKWYLHDEVGVSVRHSSQPKVRMAPLLIFVNGEPVGISLMWPVRVIEEGECITRDYLPGVRLDDPLRPLRMLGFHSDVTTVSNIMQTLPIPPTRAIVLPTSPSNAQMNEITKHWRSLPLPSPIRIFCDRADHVSASLVSHPSIEIVDNAAAADILYLIDHTLDSGSQELDKVGKVTNQYWWDGFLVSKEHLAKTLFRAIEQDSNAAIKEFVPLTFDLSDDGQLYAFVREYLQHCDASDQSEQSCDFIWILKKYRSKQSLDYPITSNLSCALRYLDSAPHVACEYLARPALFSGKKFDLRYYVLVTSLEPLMIARHELFIVRIANEEYSLTDLESFQKHFTVMNFLDDDIRGIGARNDISTAEFLSQFHAQHGGAVEWSRDVQPQVDNAIRAVFRAMQSVLPWAEVGHPSGQYLHPNAAWSLTNPNVAPARSMFGIDIFLSDSFEPKILEVQWAPDCDKAVKLMPSFWSDVLAALYLDETSNIVTL